MNDLLFVLGILLMGAALGDVLWTTLWLDGGSGPLTARLTTASWGAWRLLVPRHKHRALSLAGPFILVCTLLMWLLLLWAGWTCLFSSERESVKSTRDQTAADVSGRIYFVGYTLATMGNGDFTPRGGGWEVATALCSFSGMILLTLSVSYVLSLASAVARKRALASSISCLGKSADEWVLAFWDGRCFRGTESQLASLSSQLATVTEQHLAYPILHYYHAADGEKSAAVMLAVLDDALLLMDGAVVQDQRPAPAALRSARQAIQTFLETLQSAWIGPALESPKQPNLMRLREAGIRTLSDAEFAEAANSADHRRRRLLGLIHQDAWQWPPDGK